MSKLDIIVLDCVNKALGGNEEKLGDYIDPTKELIKALMLDLIGETDPDETSQEESVGYRWAQKDIRKKVQAL